MLAPPARAVEVEGWMSPRELGFLYETALAMPRNVRVVELGSWKGRSTVALCEGLSEKAPEFWSVDTFRGDSFIGTVEVSDVLPEFERNVSPYPFVQTIISDTVTASEQFEDGSLDWLFVDADHTYEGVTADIVAWWPKLKPGGLISGHDYCFFSVAMAVNRLLPKLDTFETIWHTRQPLRRRVPGKRETVVRKAIPFARYRVANHLSKRSASA